MIMNHHHERATGLGPAVSTLARSRFSQLSYARKCCQQSHISLDCDGSARGRTRTSNLQRVMLALCQLSYTGKCIDHN